ncbi:MAG: HAD hydrolase family protein [Candidatus Marinimicrobia bacterium]|nr:HAD hydrolase family protein [Candidatus Neomarinimicrobiota bacterium]MCF7829511.1 HAD hydrolase family protein [Candidatus Neomarinimicrobiota bacterium]MCF7880091.1 HAD hydrolase family protein [Candidatus Neomarinimicrobiota bacterium]
MSVPNSVLEKAAKIKLLVSDVDGVFTDGSIYVGSSGELKRFSVSDGMGVALARHTSLAIALLSGRHSDATTIRAEELGIGDHVYQGYLNKNVALKAILEQFGVEKSQTAYIGDDYVDIPVMREVGLAFAVPNARDAVKKVADYTLETHGGDGAVTEVIELILDARGELQQALDEMERKVYMEGEDG